MVNIRIDRKKTARIKHFSLFCQGAGDEEISFKILFTGAEENQEQAHSQPLECLSVIFCQKREAIGF